MRRRQARESPEEWKHLKSHRAALEAMRGRGGPRESPLESQTRQPAGARASPSGSRV